MPFFTTFLISAGVLGLVTGSFLNVVAYRVPAKISLLRQGQCPACDAPVRPRHNAPVLSGIVLRGKCASCGERISARYLAVEAFTALAFAFVTWWVLSQRPGIGPTDRDEWAMAVVLVAFLYFASISIALTLIDLDTHRLPNVIVLPSYVVTGGLFTVAALLAGDWAPLLRAGIGMAALYVFYFLLRLVKPSGMGGGDVKLAGIIGICLGWIGFGGLVVGGLAAFLLGGIFGIALLLLRRAGRKTAIPFGPWMILGGWTGVFAGEAVAGWYVSMLAGT